MPAEPITWKYNNGTMVVVKSQLDYGYLHAMGRILRGEVIYPSSDTDGYGISDPYPGYAIKLTHPHPSVRCHTFILSDDDFELTATQLFIQKFREGRCNG